MIPWSSWGRLSAAPHHLEFLASRSQLTRQLTALHLQEDPAICFGAGRSYGDVALNPEKRLLLTRSLDNFIAFNPGTGLLDCESGVLLGDIQQRFAAQGWLLPVSPGTQHVTVGGAIANDVHGKNHHEQGNFGHHVRHLTLIRSDGSRQTLPHTDAGLFRATIGGLGLTGVLVSAQIQLMRIPGPWLEQQTIAFHGLNDFFSLSAQSSATWPYTVAWIDCSINTPRGLFIRARSGKNQTAEVSPLHYRRMPFVPPFSLVNSLSLRLFNQLYFHYHAAKSTPEQVHYQQFLYPLDHIQDWNRLYGPAGFYQYQCVIPPEYAPEAIAELLHAISRSGQGSFLAVLKTFGNRPSLGMLSFPRPGTTLALDFPAQTKTTEALFLRLDAIVRQANGSIYMAKDARMPVDLFHSGYPQWEKFLQYRDPGMSSALSRRLLRS